MSVAYYVGSGLYVNLTNRCTADCDFCLRRGTDIVGDADTLWLDSEPSFEEVMAALDHKQWRGASEIVFCGFGEPMLRLDVLLKTARAIKLEKPGVVIRVNTNGHANLYHGTDVTPSLAGLVDIVSISLNYPDADSYTEHCKPCFGRETFQGLLDFSALAKRHVPRVVLSVIDVLPPDAIEQCGRIAAEYGVEFRVRSFS